MHEENKPINASSEMINREIIRIKIVQLTYAYYQNGNKNIDTAFLQSIKGL